MCASRATELGHYSGTHPPTKGSIMSKTAADEVSEEEEFNNTTGDKETSIECSENREHTHTDR